MAEKKKAKGVISADDWDSGTAPASDSEKQRAVLAELEGCYPGGMNTEGLQEATKINWLYGTVKALYESGKLERKKIGRGFFYRIAKEDEEAKE